MFLILFQYAFPDGRNAQQVPQLEMRDDTQKGHILGRAAPNTRSVRERDLDGLCVAATRFLLHSAMLAGTVYHAGGAIAVHDHIFPKLRSENEVREREREIHNQ